MKEIVGQNVRARRTAAGLTLADLSERVFGKPERKGYISAVEHGKIAIDVVRLSEIATALNCRASDLLVTVSYEATA